MKKNQQFFREAKRIRDDHARAQAQYLDDIDSLPQNNITEFLKELKAANARFDRRVDSLLARMKRIAPDFKYAVPDDEAFAAELGVDVQFVQDSLQRLLNEGVFILETDDEGNRYLIQKERKGK